MKKFWLLLSVTLLFVSMEGAYGNLLSRHSIVLYENDQQITDNSVFVGIENCANGKCKVSAENQEAIFTKTITNRSAEKWKEILSEESFQKDLCEKMGWIGENEFIKEEVGIVYSCKKKFIETRKDTDTLFSKPLKTLDITDSDHPPDQYRKGDVCTIIGSAEENGHLLEQNGPNLECRNRLFEVRNGQNRDYSNDQYRADYLAYQQGKIKEAEEYSVTVPLPKPQYKKMGGSTITITKLIAVDIGKQTYKVLIPAWHQRPRFVGSVVTAVLFLIGFGIYQYKRKRSLKKRE